MSQIIHSRLTTDSSLASVPNDEDRPSCIDPYEMAQERGDLTTFVYVQAIIGLLYAIIFLGGVLGNLFVIFAVSKSNRLKNIHSSLIAGLSLSDILVCVICIPITSYTGVYLEWKMGHVMCKLITSLQTLSVLVSAQTLMIISLYRYQMVVHLKSEKDIKIRNLAVINATLWLVSGLVASPFAIVNNLERIQFSENGTNATQFYCGKYCYEIWEKPQFGINLKKFHIPYVVLLLLLQYLVPLGVITFCSITIIARLQAQASFRSSVRSAESKARQENNRRKFEHEIKRNRRTNFTILSLSVVFGISWFPQMAFNFVRDAKLVDMEQHKYTNLLFIGCHIMSSSTVLWNPILYAGMNRHFKDFFRQWIMDSGTILTNWFRQEQKRIDLQTKKIRSSGYRACADLSLKATANSTPSGARDLQGIGGPRSKSLDHSNYYQLVPFSNNSYSSEGGQYYDQARLNVLQKSINLNHRSSVCI